jgi:hypothetical protein
MSSDDAAKMPPGIPRVKPKPEQQPWRAAEDAEGWTRVARGSGVPGPPPLIRVVVDLNAEQSAWLREEAKRTGLDYVTLVERLVDEKRAAAKPTARRSV